MATRKNGGEVMQRILDAATEVFATEGLAGARVDEIAAKAGVSKALIYYHIADKETLYATVMRSMLEGAREALYEAATSVAAPEERLRVAVRAIAQLASDNRYFAPLLLREIAAGGSGLPDAVVTEMRKVFGVIADILRDGAEAGNFRNVDPYATHMLVAGGVLVLMAGAPLRRRVRGTVAAAGPEAGDVPDYVASLILDGLRPARAARRKASR